PRALGLDLEQHVGAARERRLDRRPARAVAVAAVAGVLEEGALLDQRLELALGDEVVVDAVLLAGPRRARRVGDREHHPRIAGDERPAHRRLAGARGRRHDDGKARAGRRAHAESSASPPSRAASVSGWIAESTTWSLSSTRIERVRRPSVASTSLPRSAASRRSRRIGDAPGATIATMRAAATRLP